MIQLLIHLWGDYLTQSDWMAQNKTKAHLPAAVHALIYTIPFAFMWSMKEVLIDGLTVGGQNLYSRVWSHPSLTALAVIGISHFFIDRYRLARYVVWAKNFIAPSRTWAEWEPPVDGVMPKLYQAKRPMLPFRFCAKTGYVSTAPDFLSFWLLIIADNTLHLTINYIALRWL